MSDKIARKVILDEGCKRGFIADKSFDCQMRTHAMRLDLEIEDFKCTNFTQIVFNAN